MDRDPHLRAPRSFPASRSLEGVEQAPHSLPPSEDRWNLADLFSDDDAFLASKKAFQESLPRLDLYRGRLTESASVLADALDALSDLSRRLGRLEAYATLRSDSDTRVPAHQGMRQEVERLGTDFATRASFLGPELLGADPERLRAFQEQKKRLDAYAFFLRDLARRRAHVLTASEERIVAEAGLLAAGPQALFGVFQNAEMPRPEVTLSDGGSVRLTPAEFSRCRTLPVREDRRKVFSAYFDAYRTFASTLAQSLAQCLHGHLFCARVRAYPSCLAAALDAQNVPETVYRRLLEQVQDRLPLLHRYLALRARALGLDGLGYHDLHCPIVPGSPRRYGVAEAKETLLRALAPLGPDYTEPLAAGLASRWVDWHPAPGKRSGAYSLGTAYDVHPYLLLNFHGDYDGVSTLAHEAGHAMHSWLSNRAQPYPTATYPIFLAEVASTVNEALLNARLLEEATSRQEKLFLLSSLLDGFRATLFRQAQFAAFELAIHERVEAGEPLTAETLSDLYLDLLRRWHGHDEGLVEVEGAYGIEWAVVPHFYYDFYVYQYSTGIVAATSLAEALRAGRAGAADRYLGFLSAGGCDYPLEILRRAGVDLERPEPYEATFAAIERALDELEALL